MHLPIHTLFFASLPSAWAVLEMDMDRLDAMKVFLAAIDEGSLVGAGRRLKRSPATVSRAIASLEAHIGVPLLHRTTRDMRPSSAGERFAEATRQILAQVEEAELLALDESSGPQGLLTLSAPMGGEEILQPIVTAFLSRFPSVSIRFVLLDRGVKLISDGIDLALQVGELPDSSLVAIRLGGNIRRVIVASPRYLAMHRPIADPADLARHQIIALAHFGLDNWVFPPTPGSAVSRTVAFGPRMVVDSVGMAVASVAEGMGVTRLYGHHVAGQVRDGALQIVLPNVEPAPVPVHIVGQQCRLHVPKVRAFLDFAVPRLRAEFARLALDPMTPPRRAASRIPVALASAC